MKKLEVHPFNLRCLPDMQPEEYEALKEDIGRIGVIHPIVLLDGMILDGRHRYKACQELGIECPTRFINNVSPHDVVRSLNLFRCHWSAKEKAMISTPKGQKSLPLEVAG